MIREHQLIIQGTNLLSHTSFPINGLATWSLVKNGHTYGFNEGFATFCEALYWEKYWENRNRSRKDDEFHYKILQTADRYFQEAKSQYKRSIVTSLYKYPEELFDNHSYRKGGCVLHMLRHYIGEENFKRALKLYLERYSYKAVETDDLRKVVEEVSGKSLQQFFDQWFYRAGTS